MTRRVYIAYTVVVLVAIAAAVASITTVFSQTTATGTGTVTVTVTGYIAATPIDTASVITVNPANVPTITYNSIASWANANATDDMIFNMTGTNVNLTASYTYSISLPPSYPSGMEVPIVSLYLNVTNSSSPTNLTNTVQIEVQNYTITMDLGTTNLYQQYLNTGSQLTWIDLPEGFLNTFYGTSYNETQWYNYTYAEKVTIPAITVLYNPSTGTFTVANSTSLCILVADKDGSLAAGQLSGDEIVIVNPTCDFDVDSSNATAAATAPSRADLASTADYAVPGGTSALANTPAIQFYNYNQTDYTVLNYTVGYPGGVTETAYYRVELALSSTTLEITLIPVKPIPYSATLGPLYANSEEPYLHAWPAIILPVGAPAGKYTATVYIELEQT